jgi:fibronectin-binding autotransporter adhesin
VGNNSYTGPTTVLRGTTWLAGPGALPATTSLDVSAGTVLFQHPTSASFDQTVAALSGDFAGELNNTAESFATLTVNQPSNTVFAGKMKGKLNLVKRGAGTISLTGLNSHSGTTTVVEGMLSIGGIEGAITGSVVVQSGARLSGDGAVGALTVESGGQLMPGSGIGILSAGSTALQAGSTFAAEITGPTPGTGYDQLNVLGTVSLSGSVTLDLQLGFQPSLFDAFTLILNDGNEPITGIGRFVYAGNVLEDRELFTASSGGFEQQFEVRYDGNDGNDLLLVAVPEPGSALLLLGGLGLVTRRRRN